MFAVFQESRENKCELLLLKVHSLCICASLNNRVTVLLKYIERQAENKREKRVKLQSQRVSEQISSKCRRIVASVNKRSRMTTDRLAELNNSIWVSATRHKAHNRDRSYFRFTILCSKCNDKIPIEIFVKQKGFWKRTQRRNIRKANRKKLVNPVLHSLVSLSCCVPRLFIYFWTLLIFRGSIVSWICFASSLTVKAVEDFS